MENHLTETDIGTITAAVGDHQGNVSIPRVLLDVLLQDVRRWPAYMTVGFPFNIAASVKKI